MITQTPYGLYCEPGQFFIDPTRKVDKAIITHGHSDHAKAGSSHYLATSQSEGILRNRLGKSIRLETLEYGAPIRIHEVKLTFFPSGHLLGAAQIKLEHKGKITVISGDYKRDQDSTCEPFEPVACHEFISECTFGLPIYHWPKIDAVAQQINNWWMINSEAEKLSTILTYSLGKAQRILSLLDTRIGPIYVHPAIKSMNQCYQESGIELPYVDSIQLQDIQPKDISHRGILLAPPGSNFSKFLEDRKKNMLAMASGWMATQSHRKRMRMSKGFIVSDHVDWPGILQTVEQTGCEKVLFTHGDPTQLLGWFRNTGMCADSI